DSMNRRRAEIAARFTEALSQVPEVETPSTRSWVEHSWHVYALRLHLRRLTIDRARFVEELRARHIGTSVHFIPLHLHPYYIRAYGFAPDDFPVAHREFLREISLPIYSAMTDNDVRDVIEAAIDVARVFRA
ncbi:MAG: UDP-4-amino-4,6-dideoxy-N-acetyl-beta-L-altrosamine transaminase, partial [Actinobacteria bacterium]|nr:UDP-4-amino-4,6-dideoxy-N-acetyl-beta-L-altrosamine transaminase [Actinomycetota bacterium]